MTDLNIAEYNSQHRTRERGTEDGTVRVTGKKQKKWLGYYHVWLPQPSGKDKRIMRTRVIGPCSKMTKTEARDEHREWIRRHHQQPVAVSSQATLGQLADDYFLLRSGDWDEATRRTNRSVLNSILKPALGRQALEALTPEALKVFINSLPSRKWHHQTFHRLPDGTLKSTLSKKAKSGVSHSYARKTITHLRAILDLAVERDLIRKNPARSITTRLTVPRATKAVDKSYLPPSELPVLLAHLDARDTIIVWLCMLGATRPGELFAIKGGDVGPTWVYIQRALNCRGDFKGTKTEKPRTIALPPELAAELHEWIRVNGVGRDELVFKGTRDGKAVNRAYFLKHRLRKAARRAGISTLEVDFQMLRRSFGTLANVFGLDMKSIQSQLGHSRPDMTMTEYVQSVDAVTLSKVSEMESILRGRVAMPLEVVSRLQTTMVQ